MSRGLCWYTHRGPYGEYIVARQISGELNAEFIVSPALVEGWKLCLTIEYTDAKTQTSCQTSIHSNKTSAFAAANDLARKLKYA